MVEVFARVRDVLADDGTLWLNYGDSYAGRGGQSPQSGPLFKGRRRQRENICLSSRASGGGLKPKDLAGIPWRVAFALQADGWYLRQDIIWHKPNPMPESVYDRCTKSHEYLFLLAKSERYYYDADAISEPASENTHARTSIRPAGWADSGSHTAVDWARPDRQGRKSENSRRPGVTPKSAPESSMVRAKESWHASTTAVIDKRNKRSVWTIATRPYKDAHFATFPPDLVAPCILAGSREGDMVLDPFFGSGTTGMVAEQLGRKWIGIDINPEYEKLARERTAQRALA